MADNGIGSVRLFASNYALPGYLLCDGKEYQISSYRDLFNVIGASHGGDGVNTFRTPDFRARVPIHVGAGPGLSPRSLFQVGGSPTVQLSESQMAAHTHAMSGGESPATDRGPAGSSGVAESQGRIYAPAGTSPVAMSSLSVAATGGTTGHNNMQPFLAINFCIAYTEDRDITDFDFPFVCEIRMFAGDFVPRNWAACEGQLLPIAQNTAIFSLLGTYYGGDGRAFFALPDLRGRVPMGVDNTGDIVNPHYLADSGGSQAVTLTTDNLPAHAHAVTASSAAALSNDPAGKTLAVPFSGDNLYAPAAGPQTGLTGALGSTGGGQPHNNMQPYLAVNFMISLAGIWPNRT